MSTSIIISDDYAYMGFQGGSAYYGYEVTNDANADEEWCFQFKVGEKVAQTIPFLELGTRGMFDTAENLLAGIAVCIERGILRLPDLP